MGLSAISLFSGAGGLDLAARRCGIRTVCYVEYDAYAQGVLMSRIRDGGLDDAPIWDDVKTFDGNPWRGRVDIVFGGFPCQDISYAGKGAGIKEGTRSGLWSEFHRIIGEVRPRFVLVENVPGLLARGMGRVLGDLAESGYDCSWFCLGASHVGAPHRRNRVWIIAYPFNTNTNVLRWDRAPIHLNGSPELRDEQERQPGSLGQDVADAGGTRFQGMRNEGWLHSPQSGRTPAIAERGSRAWSEWAEGWSTEPNVGRVANGVALRVDRLRLCGNGVVPQQAIPAFEKIKALAGVC